MVWDGIGAVGEKKRELQRSHFHPALMSCVKRGFGRMRGGDNVYIGVSWLREWGGRKKQQREGTLKRDSCREAVEGHTNVELSLRVWDVEMQELRHAARVGCLFTAKMLSSSGASTTGACLRHYLSSGSQPQHKVCTVQEDQTDQLRSSMILQRDKKTEVNSN